jgi:hypothetical protein
MLYGYAFGNAYIYGDTGAELRAGFNLPGRRLTYINPTAAFPRPVSYLFIRPGARIWAHNIMLGSMFRGGPSRDMIPVVAEVQYGGVLAIGSFKELRHVFDISLMLSYTYRTDEYTTQDTTTSFGSVGIHVGSAF